MRCFVGESCGKSNDYSMPSKLVSVICDFPLLPNSNLSHIFRCFWDIATTQLQVQESRFTRPNVRVFCCELPYESWSQTTRNPWLPSGESCIIPHSSTSTQYQYLMNRHYGHAADSQDGLCIAYAMLHVMCPSYFYDNFGKCWPILLILSLLHSAMNGIEQCSRCHM